MASGNPLLNAINTVSLVVQIAIGLVLGILVGAVAPQVGISAGLLGSLFVGALKAIAPILVFVLVTAAIAQHQKGNQAHIKPILILYIFGTFAAAVVAVVASMAFPTTLILRTAGDVSVAPPSGIIEVLKTLLMNLVVNPIIVWTQIRRNPFPLVFTCLRESGVYAFFTRSSAANIPVNMALAKKLGLHEDTYSISIPLGATINMAGAAITITVLAMAAAYTQGITVDFATALLLSLVATVSACGASGVAGGSLLLIPLACSLFGIDNDVAMQVVAVGFIIGVIQDSAETALNSSTDVLFTAAADLGRQRKE